MRITTNAMTIPSKPYATEVGWNMLIESADMRKVGEISDSVPLFFQYLSCLSLKRLATSSDGFLITRLPWLPCRPL